jgi:hypothetical protein
MDSDRNDSSFRTCACLQRGITSETLHHPVLDSDTTVIRFGDMVSLFTREGTRIEKPHWFLGCRSLGNVRCSDLDI